MTLGLDQKITVGDVTLAALVDVSLVVKSCRAIVMGAGHKHPVAILLSQGGKRVAVLPDGRPLSPQQLDALCPEAWHMFDLSHGQACAP